MNQNYSDASLRQEAYSPEQAATQRGVFIMRVYGHLLGAIAAFTLLEIYLFKSGLAYTITNALLGVNWLLVLGGFMVAGWLARGMASRAGGVGAQYAGLALYVVAQAIIFTPMLVIANSYADGVISSAAVVTLAGFVGLTAIVFYTRKDFSFLGAMLKWAGLLALGPLPGPCCWGSSWAPGSRWPWWPWPARPSCTTPATSCATGPTTATWARPWNCSPRWPSCSGTSCVCSWGRGAD